MRRLHLLLIAGVFVSGAAQAADMPGSWTPPVSIPLPSAPINPLTGWYARIDIAYAWYRMDAAVAAPGFASPVLNDLGSALSSGAGIGYKSDWLRTDFTVDYTRLNYSGTIASSGDTVASVGAVTGLFNGYLDLGTWYCLTPYVGAGLGASYVKTWNFASTQVPPFTPGLSNSQWKFAWAAMAGTAIHLSPRLAVDVGYRYLNLGDVATASDAFGQMTLKNIAAHEVRVGARWSFNDLSFIH
jgi:opacity protein-like surface antigen